MKHPVSTITNVAYMIGGVIVILENQGLWALQDLSGLMLILLGVASMLYHWKDTWFWQKADVVMIYVAFTTAFAWQLSTFEGLAEKSGLLMVFAIVMSALFGIFRKRFDHDDIGLLAIFNLFLYWFRGGFFNFLIALIVAIIALIVGQKAETHSKNSRHYDIPHGSVWHMLTAVFMTLINLTTYIL